MTFIVDALLAIGHPACYKERDEAGMRGWSIGIRPRVRAAMSRNWTEMSVAASGVQSIGGTALDGCLGPDTNIS
jgi:hypothetical protein